MVIRQSITICVLILYIISYKKNLHLKIYKEHNNINTFITYIFKCIRYYNCNSFWLTALHESMNVTYILCTFKITV